MKGRSSQDPIGQSQLRILQYDLVDGTYELFFGAMFLLVAAILYVQAAAPRSMWAGMLAGPGLLIILPGAAFLLDRLTQRLRERITFPRIGYIVRKPAPATGSRVRRVVWIGVPVLALAVLTLLAIYRPVLVPAGSSGWERSVPVFPAFFALMMSGLWAILAWRLSLPRFYLTALLTLAGGVAIFLSRMSNNNGMVAFCAVMAFILGVSGLTVLLVYLRRNPLPAGAPDER